MNGCLYFCKKQKKFVNSSRTGCEKFERAYKRKNYEIDDIYKQGKIYNNDGTPMGLYIVILIILIIIGIFSGAFNQF